MCNGTYAKKYTLVKRISIKKSTCFDSMEVSECILKIINSHKGIHFYMFFVRSHVLSFYIMILLQFDEDERLHLEK